MKCCVPTCKSESGHLLKSERITFHVFPINDKLRRSWLRALNRGSWKPKENSTICSKHFLKDDLYETSKGLRKVRSGAVPFTVQDSATCDSDSDGAANTKDSATCDSDSDEAANTKICRICLSMEEVKLYTMKHCKLDPCYEQLTGISPTSDERLPHRLCPECAHRLLSFARFRSKCLLANSLLSEILTKQDCLTTETLKSIDRDAYKLKSPLSINLLDSTIYVLSEEKPEVTQNEPPTIHEVDLDMVVKNEDDNNAFFEDDCTDILKDEQNADSNINNEDNVASDSSCDSIPIKQLKKAKEKAKKKKKVKESTPRKKVPKKDPTEPKIDRRRKPFLNEDLNETLFTITDLTFEEQVAEIEKRQESSNYKNAVYKCTACFKGFLDEDAYETHIVRHTDACGEYVCKICKTHFKHSHALRKHITAHHTHRFNCNHCTYVTTHRQTARLHERWHKGTKYLCPHCPEEFVRFTTYMGHVRIKHPSDFVCELCGYSFVSAKGIELHKKLKHRLENHPVSEDGPKCEPCNVRFVSEDAYQRHLQVSLRHADGKDKEPKESNAPKGQRKARNMQKDNKKRVRKDENGEEDKRRLYPSQIRKAEGPIPCEQCGMQLEDSRAYHGHFRRVHPDKNRTNYPSMKSPCMCEVCGRMFQSYALLKDHTWTHTGEKPFKCSLCPKSFRMKQRLVAHRRVHSQHRATYLCNVCGKHFSTHSNRQRHMFIHTGLKPFKCEMCGKCFKHASEKRAHVTYVHLKKPWPKRARGKRSKEYDRQSDMEDQMRDGVREIEITQPWPSCTDPKINELTQIIEDKPIYYNLKI